MRVANCSAALALMLGSRCSIGSNLVVTGVTTSVCVESTVRDAVLRDYHCLVLEDCTAEPIALDSSRSNHEASLLVLELLFASITDSTALIDALEPLAGTTPTH
jgi:ureidoacrylate peracid hydrolase